MEQWGTRPRARRGGRVCQQHKHRVRVASSRGHDAGGDLRVDAALAHAADDAEVTLLALLPPNNNTAMTATKEHEHDRSHGVPSQGPTSS